MKKEVTVLVVKPDAVKAGKVEEIISKVERERERERERESQRERE